MKDNTVDIGSKLGPTFFGYKCIMDLVFRAVDFSIIMGGIGLFVFLVWGGVEWMLSAGDKTKVENAQKRITNALIGVAIVASAFAIWKLALIFFGINAPNICSDSPFS